jgi:hypothetical protein
LLLLTVFGLLVGACSDDGELGGPTVGGALAARIGSFEYTSADLEAEVEKWAENPNFLAEAVGITDLGRPGRRSSALVTFVLSHRVVSEQSRLLASAAGYEPSPEEISALLGQVDQTFVDPSTGGPLFQVYDEEFRERLGRDFAYQQNLQVVDATTAQVPEVTINPRYGTFQNQDRGIGRVNPPDGPRPAPSPAS